MAEDVWISAAMGSASNMRPLRHDLYERDREGFDKDNVARRIIDGDPVDAKELPKVIFGTSSAEKNDYKLPDLFYAYGFWIVSESAANVLRQFEIGNGILNPVTVFMADRETQVGSGWQCIVFANRKSAFSAEATTRARHGYIRNGIKGWFPRLPYKDGDIAVTQAALTSPDIWVDPDVGDAVFLSDGLARALKKAKADKGFFLGKCLVVEI